MAHLHDYRLLLNAPIGYSKNPLRAHQDVPRTLSTPQLLCETEKSGVFSLETLPPEILLKVAHLLNQHDALSMAYASKTLFGIYSGRIYEKVVVDSHYTQFSKEYPPFCTYVNLLYNFKKFIKNKRLGAVKALHVVGLPDLTNIYDADVNRLLHVFFSLLLNLHELVWLLDNFKLDYLKRLPNHDALARLELNIKYSNYLCELLPATRADDAEYFFPNLAVFHIRPFVNLRRLVRLINNLLVARGGHHVRLNLRSLKLARFDRDTTVLVPPARELATPAILDPFDDDHHEYELDTLQAVFMRSRLGSLAGLTELSLNNLLVCEKDAELLAKLVNLALLRRLELKNVSEYGSTPPETAKVGFLGKLAPQVQHLTELRLDYREASEDSVGPFLHALKELKALDMVVRINDIKKAHTNIDAMFLDYGLAIAQEGNLERFCVEIREENSFCDIVSATPIALISSLRSLSNLKSVRLNAGDGTATVEVLLSVLKDLPKLEMLDVFGARAGGAPNLGLGMIHPNVYDEWFKVQHVALLYWQAQNGIRYVRIHRCVFEFFDGTANPRDGIDLWFDSKVRVGWEQCADEEGRAGTAW